MRRPTIIVLSLFCALALAWALRPVVKSKPTTADDGQIHLIHSDKLYFDQRINRTAQFLVGHVCLEHQGTLMYCDSALYYKDNKSFDAFGHVRMVQGDTLSLIGEVLYYNGEQQLARVRHNVVMKHRQTTLYTDSLDYDRIYDLGYFFEGGRLLDDENELTSYWGQYCPTTRDAEFNMNVKLVNPAPPKAPQSTLISDTLFYNTRTGVAHVVGPSNIDHGNTHVYTENGYYHSHEDFSYLLDRSILTNVAKKLIGDSIHYDGATHVSQAFGNIEYDDRENKNKFFGHYALYNDSTGYSVATDSAVCVDYSQQDTGYVHADTFKVYTYNIDTDSVYRMLHAYHHVRAFRVDMQAVCDSLVYNGKDSCATMYKDPIVWQDGQQILGEYIKAWVNDSTIDSVHVINQALMVEKLDSLHYNQVAGKEMHSYFNKGEIYLNEAEQNVMINYHPFDSDSLMIGMVHAESTLLRMFMEEKKVQRIWMPATTGQMFPIDQIPPSTRFLENFAWFDYIRPLDKDDIFNWRPKKAGTELKPSVTHTAPQQKLSEVKKKDTKKSEERKTQMHSSTSVEPALGIDANELTKTYSDTEPSLQEQP